MKVYFEKTNGNNIVIITDGHTAKVFDGATTGKFLDVDLYSDNAAAELKFTFKLYEKADMICSYESIFCINEVSYEEISEELENAELIFEN